MTESLAEPRFKLVLIASFAGLALLMASVGIFGILAQSVARQYRDIAIRMALGARPADVIREVLREGMALTAAGLAAGTAAAAALTRLLASFLFGVAPTDPYVFASALAIFAAVAFIASVVPAIRATRADPLMALKAE